MTDDDVLVRYCPYCLSELTGDDPICSRCGEDTRNDAVHELTRAQHEEDGTKPCRACGRPIHSLASICPYCRAHQDDEPEPRRN